eukprot:gene10390-8549_t
MAARAAEAEAEARRAEERERDERERAARFDERTSRRRRSLQRWSAHLHSAAPGGDADGEGAPPVPPPEWPLRPVAAAASPPHVGGYPRSTTPPPASALAPLALTALPGMPRSPLSAAGAGSAGAAAECAICFDPLWRLPLGVFVDERRRRVCRHYFHHRCVAGMLSLRCPLCRQKFDRCIEVPSVAVDPQRWFELVDVDGDGRLREGEVADAMKASADVDEDAAEALVRAHWAEWDVRNTGSLEYAQMYGVAGMIRRHLPRTSSGRLRRPRRPPPILDIGCAPAAGGGEPRSPSPAGPLSLTLPHPEGR